MPTRLLSVNRSLLHFSPSSQSFLSHSPVIASSLFFSADHIVYQHALDRIVSHPPLPTCSPIFGYCLFSWLLVLLCRVVSRSFHFSPVDRLFVLPSLPLIVVVVVVTVFLFVSQYSSQARRARLSHTCTT